MITGYNGAGKSNVIRIIRLILQNWANGFSTCYVEDDSRIDPSKASWLRLGLNFSSRESYLLGKLLFGNKSAKFDGAEFIVIWKGVRRKQKVEYALILQNNLAVWHVNGSSRFGFIDNSIPREKLFDHIDSFRSLTESESRTFEEEKKCRPTQVLKNKKFLRLLSTTPIHARNYFLFNGDSISISYNGERDEKTNDELCQYCDISSNVGSVDLWTLLAKIFSKCIVIIDEIRPPLDKLKEELYKIKGSSSTSTITLLQRKFRLLFPEANFEIAKEDGEINLELIKGKKKYRIGNTASGYFEALYMMTMLRNENQGIVILDEPTLHLHPIKQRHFWRILQDVNNNQVIAITHSPHLVNLDLFKDNNLLINIQMISGTSRVYPNATLQPKIENLQLKSYSFKPEIFFSKCNILVEGPSDAAAVSAIADSLSYPFEKNSIQVIETGGKDVLASYVPLLEAYSIPHVALVDYDYLCDENKGIRRERMMTKDFLVLAGRLEEELYFFDNSVRTIPSFDPQDPCKTRKQDQPTSIRPERAYSIIEQAMISDKPRVKASVLGEFFDKAVIKAGARPQKFW